MKKLTISLVTYNSERYIHDFCMSLQAQTFTDWDLIVVDNNSFDRSTDILYEHFPNAKIVKQKENIGYARGHNLVVSWSRSEYLLVANTDIVLKPDSIEKLIQVLDDHDDVAAAGGKLLLWDVAGSQKVDRIDSCGLVITRSYKVYDRLQGEPDRTTESQQVFGISGALVMLRRSALESVKLPHHPGAKTYEFFDEDFFAYKEDVDLAWRLMIAGWHSYCIGETIAYHHRNISGVRSSRIERKQRHAINRYSYRNHLLMIYKNHFWNVTIRHVARIILFEVAKFFYLLFVDRSSWQGFLDVLRLHRSFALKRKKVQASRRIQPSEFNQWLA